MDDGPKVRLLPVPYTYKQHECSVCGKTFGSSSPDCLEEFCLVRGIELPNRAVECPPCWVEQRLAQGWYWKQRSGSQVLCLVPPQQSQGGEIDSTGL